VHAVAQVDTPTAWAIVGILTALVVALVAGAWKLATTLAEIAGNMQLLAQQQRDDRDRQARDRDRINELERANASRRTGFF
jgi:hypothetical protein